MNTQTWLYLKSANDPCLFTVGFYNPRGEWEPESDHAKSEDAANRVAFLNGNHIKNPGDVAFYRMHDDLLKSVGLAVDLLSRINTAFYVQGTTKALRPVMAETKPLLARLREAL